MRDPILGNIELLVFMSGLLASSARYISVHLSIHQYKTYRSPFFLRVIVSFIYKPFVLGIGELCVDESKLHYHKLNEEMGNVYGEKP